MRIAVHPWEVELGDVASKPLTDTVVSVRRDHGALLVRLTRLTVRCPPEADGGAGVSEGQVVGLSVAPSHVRIVAAE